MVSELLDGIKIFIFIPSFSFYFILLGVKTFFLTVIHIKVLIHRVVGIGVPQVDRYAKKLISVSSDKSLFTPQQPSRFSPEKQFMLIIFGD